MNNVEDIKLAIKVVKFMNELLELDREAVSKMVLDRVECNLELAKHKTVQVMLEQPLQNLMPGYSMTTVGLLGILNGLCGIREDGNGHIVAEVEGNTIKEFKILDW